MNYSSASEEPGRIPPWIWAIFTGVVAIGVLLLRKPDALCAAQFWAEDGAIFFKDAVELGTSSLLQPYAGYYLFIPRLLSLAYGVFGFRYAPLVYNLLAVLVYLFFVFYVFKPRVNVPVKFMWALLPIAGPVGMEVHGTMTNTQWVTALCLLLLLLSDSPKSS